MFIYRQCTADFDGAFKRKGNIVKTKILHTYEKSLHAIQLSHKKWNAASIAFKIFISIIIYTPRMCYFHRTIENWSARKANESCTYTRTPAKSAQLANSYYVSNPF